MQVGDKIILRAYKSDGHCYRWHEVIVENIEQNCVTVIGWPGRRIHQPDGGFVTRYVSRSHLWLDRPIFILELFEEDGSVAEIYANINSPVVVGENEVSFTDYELDVSGIPGSPVRVVDEDEFEEAVEKFGYSELFQQECYQAALDAVDLVEGWTAGEVPDFTGYEIDEPLNINSVRRIEMNFAEFESSLTQADPPADLTNALTALWYAGKSDWETAHEYCQKEEGTPDSDWVHAYLHRDEGDLPNAGYWYRRAGREMPQNTLKEEWAAMVAEMLTT